MMAGIADALMTPFTWGSNGRKKSRSEVESDRAVAAALAARRGVPQNVGEGLNAIGEALRYNALNERAAKAEEEGRASAMELYSGLEDGYDQGELMGLIGNEWADPAQSSVAQALLQQELKKQDPAYTLDLDLKRAQLEAARAPAAPKPPEIETRYNPETGREEKVQWNPGASMWEPFGGQKAPSDPLVQVNTGEGADAALNKKLSENEGEQWAGYKAAGTVSASNAQDFGVLEELIKIAPQGPVVGPLAETFKGFSSAGDAFQSIVKRIAPTLRAPGSGATSDIEYQGMLESLPALRNTPEGNTMILSIMRAKAALNVERSKLITAYQAGQIDIGTARQKMNELDSISIITPEMRQALLGIGATGEVGGAPVPQVGEVVDGYVFLGGDPSSPTSWRKQ